MVTGELRTDSLASSNTGKSYKYCKKPRIITLKGIFGYVVADYVLQ